MENLGHYLNIFKEGIKEFGKFLFDDTSKIQAHHLIAFLLTILIIYLLSYIVKKVFSTILKLSILVAVIGLVIMLLFARGKFQQLFKECKGTSEAGNNFRELK